MISSAITSNVPESGRVKRIDASPLDISKDWRSPRSIKGPRIMVRIIGARGMSSFRKA